MKCRKKWNFGGESSESGIDLYIYSKIELHIGKGHKGGPQKIQFLWLHGYIMRLLRFGVDLCFSKSGDRACAFPASNLMHTYTNTPVVLSPHSNFRNPMWTSLFTGLLSTQLLNPRRHAHQPAIISWTPWREVCAPERRSLLIFFFFYFEKEIFFLKNLLWFSAIDNWTWILWLFW